MDDSKELLIEAAVQPLADNAELKTAAAQFLDGLVATHGAGAEQTMARWKKVDAEKRGSAWRIALFLLLAITSVAILSVGAFEAINLKQALSLVTGKVTGPPLLRKAGKSALTSDEQLILYGDETQSSKAGKAKGLWNRHPENPAYFGQYAAAYLSEHDKLPEDFLTQARRIDPQNAWFLYLAAGVEVKDCIKRQIRSTKAKAAGEMPELEIIDRSRLDRALRLIREARDHSYCNDYKAELMRQKILLLPKGNQIERLISMGYIGGMTESDVIIIRKIGEAIAAKAVLLGREKNTMAFRELMADSDAFTRKTLATEPSTLVAGLVCRFNVSSIFQGLAAGARDLGIHPEAEQYQAIYDHMFQVREAHKKRELLVAGVEFLMKSGFLAGRMIPVLSQQAANPPVISDLELKPGRLMEHEILSKVSAVAAFLLLGICLALVMAFRFRQSAVVRCLALRMESLLLPVDWFWMIGSGIVLPFLLVVIINRLTPLGGRDFSVFGMRFVLPMAHFFGLVLLMLIVPILIARWRLGKRAAIFGFAWSKSWIGWVAVISIVAYIGGIGFVAPSASVDLISGVTVFLLLPKIWLLAVAVRAVWAKPAPRLMSSTIGRVLVPVYASAMLLMISLVPILKAAEQYWFERDTFMELDPAFPGMSTYEYKVAVQLQKELQRELAVAGMGSLIDE